MLQIGYIWKLDDLLLNETVNFSAVTDCKYQFQKKSVNIDIEYYFNVIYEDHISKNTWLFQWGNDMNSRKKALQM